MSKVSSKSYVGKEFVTESGLIYTIHRAGEGERAASGKMVLVHYSGRLQDGTPFDNSYDRGEPFKFNLGAGQVIKGWDEGIALLNVGDSATLVIPPNLGYGSKTVGTIPPNSTLIFTVELVAVMTPAQPYDVSGKDTVEIEEGLKIIYLNRNEDGVKAQSGMNVTVHYSGYFKNWKKFDSSVDRGDPFRFPLGQGRVIKGWDLGIAQMRTGEKARLIISPEMGYGERGYATIPGNATLFFDVELIEAR
jgi:peptidylprolyl isomerase